MQNDLKRINDTSLENLEQFKGFIKTTTLKLVVPLYPAFILTDHYYAPEYTGIFLPIRILVVIYSLVIYFFISKVKNYISAQIIGLSFVSSLAVPIHWMIIQIDSADSAYYAGLNLIAIGAIAFFPWSRLFLALNLLVIYLPYLIYVFLVDSSIKPAFTAVNLSMTAGVVIALIVLYGYVESLRSKERIARKSLMSEINSRDQVIREKIENEKIAQRKVIYGEFAQQVAHDIRSPIAALNVVSDRIASDSHIEEEFRSLIQSATKRIRDIAADLLHQKHYLQESIVLGTSLNQIFREKSYEFRSHPTAKLEMTIDPNIGESRVPFSSSQFSRIISNLINNAVEASNGSNHVHLKVSIHSKQKKAEITIEDQGIGIPGEILKDIGRPGFTHGKLNGSGIGISSAVKAIQTVGGSFDIHSIVGQGTRVTIYLPLCSSDSSKT